MRSGGACARVHRLQHSGACTQVSAAPARDAFTPVRGEGYNGARILVLCECFHGKHALAHDGRQPRADDEQALRVYTRVHRNVHGELAQNKCHDGHPSDERAQRDVSRSNHCKWSGLARSGGQLVGDEDGTSQIGDRRVTDV